MGAQQRAAQEPGLRDSEVRDRAAGRGLLFAGNSQQGKWTRCAVSVAGRRVYYRMLGAGEPVVLVHGLSGSTRWWRPVAPVLARSFRVYVLDLPGFGGMKLRGGHFVLGEAARWLLSWMEAAGVQRAHLVGHSMGGYICLQVAATRPEKVPRLVLIAPAAVPAYPSLARYVAPLARALRTMRPGFLPVLAYDAARAGPLTLLRASRDLLREDATGLLRSVRAPTLLIWGTRDTLVPPELARVLQAEIPNAQVVMLERSGHVPMYDQPGEVAAAIGTFLTADSAR